MNCIKTLTLFLILTGLSACVKDIVLDKEFAQTQMVTSCLLDNNSLVTVFLTQSNAVDGNVSIHPVTGALVELLRNDTFMDVLPFVYADSIGTFGRYEWNEHPVPGNKYGFRISHPAYGTVTGADDFPPLPDVSGFEILQHGDSTNAFVSKIRFSIQDNGLTENYYRLNLWNEGRIITGIQQNDTSSKYHEKYAVPEPLTELGEMVRDYGVNLLFTDRNFSGQQKEFVFQFKDIDRSTMYRDTLKVAICGASKAAYDYHISMTRYHEGNPGYEAVPVYSNISNGYGVIVSQSVRLYLTAVK